MLQIYWILLDISDSFIFFNIYIYIYIYRTNCDTAHLEVRMTIIKIRIISEMLHNGLIVSESLNGVKLAVN